jgi:hypothetical protein
MIIFVFILFAIVLLAIAVYLLMHQQNLFGVNAEKLGKAPAIYGWLLLLLALATIISTIIYRDAALPTTIFIIIGTVVTTTMTFSISRRLFL